MVVEAVNVPKWNKNENSLTAVLTLLKLYFKTFKAILVEIYLIAESHSQVITFGYFGFGDAGFDTNTQWQNPINCSIVSL